MLLPADRGFYSFYTWEQAPPIRTQLLWRVQANLHFDHHLPDPLDGSWLALASQIGRAHV